MYLAALPTLTLLMIGQTTVDTGEWQPLYETATYANAAGESLPYRLMRPQAIEAGERYPLVLYFHGAGERGNDNNTQLYHIGRIFGSVKNRQDHPCFVLAAQCPLEKRWVEVDWALPSHTMPKEPSSSMRLTLELIDKLAAELPIDLKRIYVTGLSMGGFGTWDAIQRRPDLFAAAIPICGGGDTAEASKLKSIPIWAFHGDHDSVVLVRRTKDMIAAIEAAGGTPKMTLYPNVDHDSWSRTYADSAVLDWLFEQHRR